MPSLSHGLSLDGIVEERTNYKSMHLWAFCETPCFLFQQKGEIRISHQLNWNVACLVVNIQLDDDAESGSQIITNLYRSLSSMGAGLRSASERKMSNLQRCEQLTGKVTVMRLQMFRRNYVLPVPHRVEDKKRALHHEVRGICIALYTTQAISKRNKQQNKCCKFNQFHQAAL